MEIGILLEGIGCPEQGLFSKRLGQYLKPYGEIIFGKAARYGYARNAGQVSGDGEYIRKIHI